MFMGIFLNCKKIFELFAQNKGGIVVIKYKNLQNKFEKK